VSRVLLVDNYDSFAFNVVQVLRALGAEVIVRRNDAVDEAAARALAPTHLVISPGPGHPRQAGASVALISAFLGQVPILEVCLGHQALAVALGGELRPARALVHGEASAIDLDGEGLFAGLPRPLQVGRYHSLAIDEPALPAELVVCARAPDGEVMAVRHRGLALFGVPFHPESVLTPDGPALLGRFLEQRCSPHRSLPLQRSA